MATNGVKGINETIKELRKYGDKIEREIDGETRLIAFQIEKDAITLAPKDNGFLHSKIRHYKVKDSNYAIGANAPYAAYMEFGTGVKVSVPSEMKDIAQSFKGKSKGTYEEGLEAIEIWCSRKGISKEIAKLIFWKILKVGINPKPFLYPAWVKGKKDYLQNLTRLLSKYNKKI